ncbi:MAG: S8 family serine peptidase [Flammeovirgaceae bacterium]|nr:S8 family serine peptidase [Flammeovirgaceae bacterium]
MFSVIGAYSEGTFTGGAHQANFHLYVTEDVTSEYHIEEYNWLFAAEKADSIGVHIINSSLAYNTFDDSSMDYAPSQMDGNTAISTKAAVLAASKGIIVVNSVGNSGGTPWQIVAAPADADGILAVGSVTSTLLRSTFSGVGPTADGRVKPDVMAQGSGTSKVNSNGTISTSSGTSLSSPLIAALAAGVWQSYPDFSSNEIIEAIVQSADRANNPDNLYGYGIPNFMAVHNYLQNKSIEDELFVYPNPTVDSVSLIIKNPSDQPVDIIVFDSQGRLVHEFTSVIQWSNNPQVLDFTQQPAGLYIIRVISNNGTSTVRLIKD